MFRHSTGLTVTAMILACVTRLDAQHDLHRNSVQAIAESNLKWAAHELGKAEADDPETHFVRTLLLMKQGDVGAAEKSARAALEAGLPLARFVAGPRDLLAPLYETPAFKSWMTEQRDSLRLLHGPMLGSVTASQASFWVRTARASRVQIVIGNQVSEIVEARPDRDFTAVVTVTGLEPATRYDYELLIDGQAVPREPHSFMTFPRQGQAARFAVAFGGGAGYTPESESMWDTIRAQQPLALLMLGDNVYIDQPEYSLCQHYCYYRRQARPEWRRLVGSTATFAIYDDHDFGTDDCIPGPEIDVPPWKRAVWNVFRQNWVNPSYGGGASQPGCWFDFHIGDVHFIMLDGRYYRDLNGGSMLGPAQKTWLLETLRRSQATFKVLASPVPWSQGVKEGSPDPWDGFPGEREAIFSFLETHKINGVFLIAADRHRTDLRKTARPDGYDLYEFESSRLTNIHFHPVVETPGLVWGYNETCSFGLMRFDTAVQDPQVTFECVSIDGTVVHRHELRASSLRHP